MGEFLLALNDSSETGGAVAQFLVKEVCELSPVPSSIRNRPIVCEKNQEIEILWALKVLSEAGGTAAHLLVKEVCDLSPVSSSIRNRPIVCEKNQGVEILGALKVFSEAGETFIRLIESLGALKDFSETGEIDALMARIYNSMQEQIEDYKAVETYIRLIDFSLALNVTGGTAAHFLVKEVCDLSPVSSPI